MSLIDSDKAVDMWLKVAQKSRRDKRLDDDSSDMFNWTLYYILKSIDVYAQLKFATSIFKNREFCDYMYKLNTKLGDEESKIIKWAIFMNNAEGLLYVLNSVQKNKSKNGYTIGKVIFTAINEYSRINCEGHILGFEVKSALSDFINGIKNKLEKSEANVALMSII